MKTKGTTAIALWSWLALLLTPTSALGAAESIFPDSATADTRPNDAPSWELGTIFEPEVPGKITQVRVFSLADESGDHQVRIWRNSDGALLAGPHTWNFGGTDGWIALDIDDVPVQAGVEYTVSISAPAGGWYPANAQYFAVGGNNAQHLAFPPGAGVFIEATGSRPTKSYADTAYLRDVVFEPDLGARITGHLRFGNGSEGTRVMNIDADQIFASRFMPLRNMRLSALNAKVRAISGNYKCAVYSDNSGAADRLLQQSAGVVNATNGWQTFTLTQPLDVVPNSFYWLAIWADTPGAAVYVDDGSFQRGNYPYGDWPDPLSLTDGSGNSTLCLYADGLPVDVTGPEMTMQGNRQPVEDGSVAPSVANGTDFRGATANGPGREMTFTILDVGKTALQFTGNPAVSISGAQASDFVVTAQPGATVEAGATSTLKVRFNPTGFGARNATVLIAHADSPTNAFSFAVHGVGLGGGAGVLGNDSEGTSSRPIDNNIHGNRFQAPVDLHLTAVHAKVVELAGTFKCAIYSDNNGWADRLLRGSVEVVNATNGWNTFTLTSPVDVSGGNYYWLVIWSDTVGARVQFDPIGFASWTAYPYTDNGGQWPDPIDLSQNTLGLDGANRLYCVYAEGTPAGASPGPEMDLRGKGKLIVASDSTPSLLDGTDFGSADVTTGKNDQIFTIQNPGDTALALNLPITISGRNSVDFNVVSPPVTPIPAGGSANFTLRYDPVAVGLSTATVTIASTDPDENPYTFAVQGAGSSTGRESIWPDTKLGKAWPGDNAPYELGMVFRASVKGRITHLRVYAVAAESGDHTARIWRNADETVIFGPSTWTYGGTNGWITLDIDDVDIDADTDYTVVVTTGRDAHMAYANIGADLLQAGNNGQHLSWPANSGVFSTTLDVRPTDAYHGGNYLRDIVFVPAGTTPTPTAPHIAQVTADLGTGNVTLTWDGDGPQFQVYKASKVDGPYQAVPGGPVTARQYTDPGALKAAALSFYRVSN